MSQTMSCTKKGPGRRHKLGKFKYTERGKSFWIKGYPGAKLAKQAKAGRVGLKLHW